MSCVFHGPVLVHENAKLARDTYRLRIEAPALARAIRPGQFLMLRLAQTSDPLLGRAFALYDTVADADGNATNIDVVYLVVGKLTRQLTRLRIGDFLEAWGPLGNGFPDLTGLDHVGLVAGGIGQTPFLAYARDLLGLGSYAGQRPERKVRRVSFFYGVRTASLAAGLDDFRSTGARIHLATDDGTLGFHGLVTDLVAREEMPQHLVGCGPEPMLSALSALAAQKRVPCHVSLETPMACGIGICFSCVTRVRTAASWDYRRVCVEGPVFDAECLADFHQPGAPATP
jgi:dihydroorotate dehydrogenase electron transfer subunit